LRANFGAMVSADALRKRPAGAGGKEKRAPAKEDGDEDKYDRKPPVTSSADPDRKPDGAFVTDLWSFALICALLLLLLL